MTYKPFETVTLIVELEKEITKLGLPLKWREDKRRGVEYVMSKILGFYKECLELRLEYLTGMDDKGEVTTWMAFGGNIHDLGSFGEETDKTTDLHQDSPRIMFSERGDSVRSTKRRRRDLFGDGVIDLVTAS
ncbi:hypothetical protein Tco_1363261 [Tanacetum coccineum]